MAGKKYDDDTLLQGIKDGDAAILGAIYARFLPPVTQLLIRRNATTPDAEDIFEDVLVALYIRLQEKPLILQNCKLQTYITGNCIKQWSNKSKRKKRMVEVTPELLQVLESNDHLEEELFEAEEDQLFWRQFEQMPADCQQVLRLFFEGYSLKEIAEQKDYTYKYARKKKSVCNKQLIENIKADPLFKELKD